MTNPDSSRLLIPPGRASSASPSGASSIKSSKSSRLSSWFHRKERTKDKIGKASQHSQNNSSQSPTSLSQTVDSLSIQQAPYEFNPVLAIQPVFSLNIFPKNTTRVRYQDLPKIGQRIEDVAQLVHCARLLQSLESPMSPPPTPLSGPSFLTPSTTQGEATESPLSKNDIEWLEAVGNKSVEKDRIRQLVIGIVSEFINDPIKDAEAIREVVLIGPVLERGHFRSLLTCFVTDFQSSPLLVVEKLQGLIQLVQEALPGYIEADDLINILDAITKRLQGTAAQSDDFSFHLALAVSKVLGVMADQNVEGLDRVLQHDPLGKALTALKKHDNPFLRYQAIYGFQALQWVPNNESDLQRSLRLFAGMATGLIKVAGVIQLDFNGFLGGLKDIQQAAEETVDIVKAGIEDFNAMIENGQELAECLKSTFGSKQKGLWYISLRAAQELVRRGQLADFNTLVREAPSHQGYMFQWGICQLLGDIAVDACWDKDTREQAIRFLGETFSTTTVNNVRRWILTILHNISTTPTLNSLLADADEEAIKSQAYVTIGNLDKKSGEGVFPFPYLLGQRLPPPPQISGLLRRVNKTADLEPRLLKLQSEMIEGGLEIYIPLMSKASLQDSGERLDPLEDRVTSFLNDKKEVLLILGDSGAGKSTFNRHLERELWIEYQPGGTIPLFIDLKTMGKLNEVDIVKRKLARHGFNDTEIQELKEYRRMILICDGYDECRQWIHLHSVIREEGWKSFQIVITCRTQYLTPAYRNYFIPRPIENQSVSEASALFEVAAIVPFKSDQIESYVDQFKHTREAKNIFDGQPVWSTETYLKNLSNLKELVKNPLILKLALLTLPSIVGSDSDSSKSTMTRFSLYDAFVTQHLGREAKRLGEQRMGMSEAESEALGTIEDDFVVHGIHFSMRLAHRVFIEQGGVNVIEYSAADSRGWKSQFFGPKAASDVKLLRQSCQLDSYTASETSPPSSSRSIGPKRTIFSFTHRSILEFFYSCRLCDFVPDLRDLDPSSDESQYTDLSICLDPTSDISLLSGHPFNQRNIVSESSIVHFLVEYANADPQFKDQLLAIVNLSKTNPAVSQASSNSMTILVQAGVQFNSADLRGIRIPGADLRGGHFDHAQLQGADMTGVNLNKTWLRHADFSGTQMIGVQFGEKPYLEAPEAWSMALSPDRRTLLLGCKYGDIKLLDTADWSTRQTLNDHSMRVNCLTFSSSGHQFASGSSDDSVRIWNLHDGMTSYALCGHTSQVSSVAFSPDGLQLVSGSADGTVRVWNLVSKSCTFIFNGHSGAVYAVAWSPDGQQIASGGVDKTLRLWRSSSGILEREIDLESKEIWRILYNPHSQRLIVGTDDDILIWDAQALNDPLILKGHNSDIYSLAISPDGRWIVSGSGDTSANIWNEQTGELAHTFHGHSNSVVEARFLNNREVLSLGFDRKMRVWGLINDSEQRDTLQKPGHKQPITSVVYSPDGKSILSGSFDETTREWDAETGYPGTVLQSQGIVWGVAYSPDGKQLAIAAMYDNLKLLDRESGADGTAVPMQDLTSVYKMSFSPCGRWLATGYLSGALQLWDLQSGTDFYTLEGHTDSILGITFRPDGLKLVSWSEDGSVLFWDTSDTTRRPVPVEDLELHVQALVFSPCGTMFAWCNSEESDHGSTVIHICDVQSMQIFDLQGHDNAVLCLAWSSEWIASGGFDRTVRLWKSQTIESVSKWSCMTVIRETMGFVTSVGWNPVVPLELVIGDYTGSLCVWRLTEDEGGNDVKVCLKWGLTDRLIAQDANIANALGLDDMQRKLLQQNDAIDEIASVTAGEEEKDEEEGGRHRNS